MSTTFDTPTAANVLSSLGIRGATVTGGATAAGKIPVVGANGLLSVSLIPASEISSAVTVPTLANTAFVDPGAGAGRVGYTGTGSIAAPFVSLDVAAGQAAFCNFVLLSGDAAAYGSSAPVFQTTAGTIRICCLGTAAFSSLALDWTSGYKTLILQNVSVNGTLRIGTNKEATLQLIGKLSVGKVQGVLVDTTAPFTPSNTYLTKVYVSAEANVINYENVGAIAYPASSARILNASTEVAGNTVAEATDTLGKRRIRIPVFATGTTGITTTTTDVAAESDSSDDYEIHDASTIGTTLATAVNATFYKAGDNPTFGTVTATTTTVGVTTSETLSATAKLLLNTTEIKMVDGFLTVGEGADDTYIRNAATGRYHRLQARTVDGEVVLDVDTVGEGEDSSASDSSDPYGVVDTYVRNPTTGKYHKITAESNVLGELSVSVEQNGVNL